MLYIFQNELEFLDLDNLDEHGREELTALLKPNVINEGLKLPWDRAEHDYNENSEQIQAQEMPKVWQQYGNIITSKFLIKSIFLIYL